VGDLAFQKKCLGKLGDVVKEGRTILFVSHNMNAISNLTQNCLWLEEGRIIAEGKTDRVIKEYVTSLSNFIPNEGWNDITGIKRHSSISLDKGRIDWVQVLDERNKQSGTFLEGEPITVVIGFRLTKQVQTLQFGCSVDTVDGTTKLFTVPSKEFFETKNPGNYEVRVYMEPNHLRHGDYSLGVKMFADGQRQDTIGGVARLNIQPYLSAHDNPAYLHKWVAGYMRFNYEWGSIQGNATNQLHSSISVKM